MAEFPAQSIELSRGNIERLSHAWRLDWLEYQPMLEEGEKLLIGG
jgi:hypothetical protein